MTIEKTLTADLDQPVRVVDNKGIVYIGPQWWVHQQIWETNESKAVGEDNKYLIKQYLL